MDRRKTEIIRNFHLKVALYLIKKHKPQKTPKRRENDKEELWHVNQCVKEYQSA